MAYENNDGRPPVPGSTQRRENPMPQSQPPQPRMDSKGSGAGSAVKGAIAGGIAGAAVSAALVAALAGAGVVSFGRGSASAGAPASAESVTAGSQTINLAAAGEDATIAEAVAAKCLPSVVAVHVESDEGSGIGSGVILDADGNIITNWHVAGDANAITVSIEGKTYDATLVGGDASSDIAVIKADLEGAQVTPMEIGDSSQLVVGDWVMTLGSPLGLDQSASSGIVSALYRNELMTGTAGNTLYTNLIQVDAAINGGNSGGALVNDKGQLVGINTLYANAAGTETFSGIGFAIPGNYAVDIANKVIAGEKVTHAYIGLSCSTVTPQNAQENHLSVTQGAYVAEVAEGGPAEAAGFEVGDIITKIGDKDVTSADSFILAVRSYNEGDVVECTVMRGNDEKTLMVEFGSDEELQAQQEEQRKQQEEEYQRYMEEYQQFLEQYQNQQMWPWENYGFGF